jgi:hypothetical protein
VQNSLVSTDSPPLFSNFQNRLRNGFRRAPAQTNPRCENSRRADTWNVTVLFGVLLSTVFFTKEEYLGRLFTRYNQGTSRWIESCNGGRIYNNP